jgi:hypothetical protein
MQFSYLGSIPNNTDTVHTDFLLAIFIYAKKCCYLIRSSNLALSREMNLDGLVERPGQLS